MFNSPDSTTAPYSRHHSVFGKFAAHEAARESFWGTAGSGAPLTPLTPSLVHSEITVSPEELFSTPLETDLSPLFDDIDVGVDAANWDSLFDEVPAEAPREMPADSASSESQSLFSKDEITPIFETEIETSELETSVKRTSSETQLSGLDKDEDDDMVSRKRRRSSSPRIDEFGIVAYSRKPRSQPLKPVLIPESGDDSAAKRAKNTEAARRSRARKMERMGQLECRVRELTQTNELLEDEVKRLRRLLDQRL